MRAKILFFGLLASFFFSFTFILNRSMSLTGGHFIWSTSLRYIFSLPFLFIIVLIRRNLTTIHNAIRKNLFAWILWSTVGFGLFYLPLTFASNYGSSWLIAATWQFSIVAGILMTPLFGHKIPKSNLYIASMILIGVFIMQVKNFASFRILDIIYCLLPVMIAAISYILGNRKMMQYCLENISTIERIYGMTLCSMPMWIICSIYAFFKVGLPTNSQVVQSFLVCILSALIATILFFYATDLAKGNPKLIAVAESTIAGEVIFTVIGGYILLKDPMPDVWGWIGLIIIISGIILNSKEK